MMRTGLALLFSVLSISLPAGRNVTAAAPNQQQAPVNAYAQATADFKKRVDAYLTLRKAVTQKYPEVKETSDPNKIHEREVPWAGHRDGARGQGRRRVRRLSPYLQRIVDEDWKSRSAADRKALFEEIPTGPQAGGQSAVSHHDPAHHARRPSCWPGCRRCRRSSSTG